MDVVPVRNGFIDFKASYTSQGVSGEPLRRCASESSIHSSSTSSGSLSGIGLLIPLVADLPLPKMSRSGQDRAKSKSDSNDFVTRPGRPGSDVRSRRHGVARCVEHFLDQSEEEKVTPVEKQDIEPGQSQLESFFTSASTQDNKSDLMTPGSLGHSTGSCTPCVWMWKTSTACRYRETCSFCHLCDALEVKRRRKKRDRELKVDKEKKNASNGATKSSSPEGETGSRSTKITL